MSRCAILFVWQIIFAIMINFEVVKIWLQFCRRSFQFITFNDKPNIFKLISNLYLIHLLLCAAYMYMYNVYVCVRVRVRWTCTCTCTCTCACTCTCTCICICLCICICICVCIYVYMSVNSDSIGSDKGLRIGGHLCVCVCVCGGGGGGGGFLTDCKSERLQVRMSHEPWIMNPVPVLYYFISFLSEPTPWLSYCAFGMECCQISLLSQVNTDSLVIVALGTHTGLSGIIRAAACCVWIKSLCPLNINVKCLFCSTPSL